MRSEFAATGRFTLLMFRALGNLAPRHEGEEDRILFFMNPKTAFLSRRNLSEPRGLVRGSPLVCDLISLLQRIR